MNDQFTKESESMKKFQTQIEETKIIWNVWVAEMFNVRTESQ